MNRLTKSLKNNGLMLKRWTVKEKNTPEKINQLSESLGITSVLAELLYQRGVTTFQEAKDFFRPSLANLHDPFLMKDMDKAIHRIEKAINQNEKILIFGDYDVDGTTAVALVYTFIKERHKNIDYYIPDRYTEGYGISTQGITWAKENNFSLIIALDCGIKSIDKIDYANSLGIDFIICDHHLPGDTLPKAIAVLDPKRADCNYPFKELSGCGIGFKLIQAYCRKNNLPEQTLEEYLDLAVVSIAADIVPVTDENRILAYYGLKQINSNPRKGFKAMFELANFKKEITITDIVFTIAPRINAAGRLESGKRAVELLISDDTAIAMQSGQNINITNTERRTIDSSITEQALSMIESDTLLLNKKSTVLFHPEWHKGVVGIVASRLIEKYYRPTIVLTQSNGMATGSARSVKNFDVYEAIAACSDLLEQFGGHKYAAGLTLKTENVDQFIKTFEEVVSKTITDDLLIPEIEIDAEISLSTIDDKFIRILKQLAPFGPGNMAPVFLTKNIVIKDNARTVGNNHLKIDVSDKTNSDKYFPAIGFNLGVFLPDLSTANTIDICYSIEENEWNGNVSLQLNIKDIMLN